MSLLLLLVLPCVMAVVGQAFRGIRVVATLLSLATLLVELLIIRGAGPQDAVVFGMITLSVNPLASLLLQVSIFLTGAMVLYNHGTRSDGLSSAALLMLGVIAAVLLLNNFLLITLLVEIIGVGIVLFSAGPRLTRAGVGAVAQYLAAAVIASICLIFGFLLIDIYRLSAENVVLARLVLALVVVGFGIRLCGFPFHFWLPEFSEHSPPILTALFVSVLTLAMLAFLIAVFSTFPWILAEEQGRALLMAGGVAGALIGAVVALGQPSINRVLAYSTVSDMGLIVFGLGTVSNLGLSGAVFQAVTMSLGKLLLLMCAGIVGKCFGEVSLARLGGLASKLPITTIGFIAGGLSIAGYPPFAGFSSRWVLLNVAGKHQGVLAVWIVIVSALLLLAYVRVFRQAFLGEPPARRTSREPFLPSLVILGLAAVVLAIGLYPAPLFGQIQTALAGITFAKLG